MVTRPRRLPPRYGLWLAVAALLAWVLTIVSPEDIWQVLGRLGFWQLIALAVANSLILLSMSGRWWLILRAQGYDIPYLTLAGYRLAAFGVSYFTLGPQFGGEPLQVYLLKRHHGVPGSTAIAAVTLDKLLELLINFTFLAGGTAWILRRELWPGPTSPSLMVFTLGLLAGPALALVLLGTGRLPFTALGRGLERLLSGRPWPIKAGRLAAFRRAVQVISDSEQQAADFCQQQPAALVQAWLGSLLTWGLMIGEYWLMLRFLGAALTFDQTIVAMTAARLAILFPLPGGLGALEASQVMAMGLLGLEPAVGLSLSLLIRARDVLVGSLGLWWGGVKS
ncbi:MAG: lysylphosphatidylglycerol synthase transmembrane domain-containing protein [Chloroflexota bacterium]